MRCTGIVPDDVVEEVIGIQKSLHESGTTMAVICVDETQSSFTTYLVTVKEELTEVELLDKINELGRETGYMYLVSEDKVSFNGLRALLLTILGKSETSK